jgi:hypothetical protein
MTPETLEWLEFLGKPKYQGKSFTYVRCADDASRLGVVRDLLGHAKEDEMSEEDRQICREAFHYLQERIKRESLSVLQDTHP